MQFSKNFSALVLFPAYITDLAVLATFYSYISLRLALSLHYKCYVIVVRSLLKQ